MSDSDKAWIKPVAIVAVLGLLFIGGIAYFLISKAPKQHEAAARPAASESDEAGLAPQTAVQTPAAQSYRAPAAVEASATPPPPPGGGDAPQQFGPPQQGPASEGEPGQRQRPQRRNNADAATASAPQAQAAADSGSANAQQSNQNQRQRVSRKERMEKTAPEDRARMVQMRIEEAQYRNSHKK
jgi:type IV secretory pathway VirB10-like protein